MVETYLDWVADAWYYAIWMGVGFILGKLILLCWDWIHGSRS